MPSCGIIIRKFVLLFAIRSIFIPIWKEQRNIHPKRDWREADADFCPKPYYQVFDAKYGFLPNLSIADLLFNMGPESLIVLRDIVKGINHKE